MISIIIPAYNYAHFLPFAVESALAQASAKLPVEVIVVDDGSTDHTPEVLRVFGPDIRYVRQENQGLSAARNTGMREARGEYFVFLDADDLLTPGVLASQLRTMELHEADVVICLNEEVRAMAPAGPFWPIKIWHLIKDHIPVHLCLHNIAPPHAFLIRRRFASHVGLFDATLMACEDHDYWLRCAVSGAAFAINPDGLVLYRKHNSSMSAKKQKQLFYDAVLHERVGTLLATQPKFVGDYLPEAWMAHADGCLRTVVNLLTISNTDFQSQNIAIASKLVDLACSAIRNVAKKLWSGSASQKHLSAAYPLLQFYVLSVQQQLFLLENSPFQNIDMARNTMSRLFPQWSTLNDKLRALCNESWQQLTIAQESQDVNSLIAPILASAKSRNLDRITTVERPAVLLGSDFFWPSTGGCEQFMGDLGRQLLGAGYDVHVATRSLEERNHFSHEGMHIIPFACTGRIQDGFCGNDLEQYNAFIKHVPFHARIFLGQPDFWMLAPLLDGPLPGKTFVIPVINFELVDGWNRSGHVGLVAHVLRNATMRLSLTQSGLDKQLLEAVKLSSIFLPHAIREYPPGPDFRERHNFDATPLLVLVANLWPVKNHLSLIHVLRNTPGKWRLALIGNSLPWPDERRYAEEARALAAADPRMTILGGLPPEEADAAIAAADILLLPSKAECRPLVILQAMRHGTPWIATPQCNSVQDDAGGLICPIERFGEAVAACLANPGARHALGELGRTHWQERFRWEVILPCFIQLIEQGRIEADLTMPPGLRAANAHLQRKLLGASL